MRSPPASRTPRTGASRGTPARSLDGGGARAQEAAARALSTGWVAGRCGGAEPGLGDPRGCRGPRAAGWAAMPLLRGVGGKRDAVQPRAAGPGVTPSAGKAAIPPRSFRRVGPGSRPAALREKGLQPQAPDALPGAPSRAGGRRRGLSFVTSQPRRRGPRATPGMPCAQLCSRAAEEACTPIPRSALLFGEPLPAPAARSQSQERKKKRGAGALRTPASSQCSCGETAALLLAERGREGEAGRGPGQPAPEAAAAPPAGSERRVSPTPGATASGRGWMLARPSPRALSCLKRYRVFGDQPGKPRHVRKTRETSGGE